MAAGAPVSLPHTWRPFGARMAIFVFGGGLAAVFVAAAVLLADEVNAFTAFQKVTVVFFVLLALACGWAIARCRITADERSVTVVNGYRRRVYEWPQVVDVSLRRGAPWAGLDLSDGTQISVVAIQGSDGPRAEQAVRELRALIAAHAPPEPER
ncbi:MAG TPA: PH domain-containing protein [Marmoricola sp.]|nr:PH domain-containing protein [Marmoricola sp.]